VRTHNKRYYCARSRPIDIFYFIFFFFSDENVLVPILYQRIRYILLNPCTHTHTHTPYKGIYTHTYARIKSFLVLSPAPAAHVPSTTSVPGRSVKSSPPPDTRSTRRSALTSLTGYDLQKRWRTRHWECSLL